MAAFTYPAKPQCIVYGSEIWTVQSSCTVCRLQAAYAQPDKSSLATTNLVLDAHRQVFEAFNHSFTTYRPLLLKIQGAYEEALQDALNSQADNIHMKAQLAALHQRKAGLVACWQYIVHVHKTLGIVMTCKSNVQALLAVLHCALLLRHT